MKRKILAIAIICLLMVMVIFTLEGSTNAQNFVPKFIPGSPTPPTLEELKAMENAPIGEPLEPTGQLWIYMPNPRLYQPPMTTTLTQTP
ncbi:MAG: hypothetical protein NUV70_08895 [Caldiserica bacterium]|jgi:hypothetical protein|nr:hypothetical protein [Caldisericota bacterium]